MSELQVQKKASFLLRGTAKGWERGDLPMADTETKGYPFPCSLSKHLQSVQSLLGALLPFPSRSIQGVLNAVAEARMSQFLACTEFLPTLGPFLLPLAPPRLPTPPSLFFSLGLNVISSTRLSLTTVYVVGFPSAPATLHYSQNLWQFVVLHLPVHLVIYLPSF